MIKSEESGRTMLEMLGVLAIMGIITYGAIAGINYGMVSYRINQTYADVQEIVQGVQDLYSWSPEYPASETDIMKAACNNDLFSGSCTTGNEFHGGAFGEIKIVPTTDQSNFVVIVVVSDENIQSRLAQMDWHGLQMLAKCNAVGGDNNIDYDDSNRNHCLFSPQ